MSTILRRNPESGKVEYQNNSRPTLGWQLQVGSIVGRTYAHQDYWHCTEVTEILEEREDYIRFRTLNSEYEWKTF
jgi:hypothetical protein